MDNVQRRRLLFAVAAMFIAPLAAVAQQASKLRRIGLLWIRSDGTGLQAFRERLRALGYAEGTSILIDERFLVDSYDQIPKAASELVKEKPDVIVTFGSVATRAAYNATKRIPIVMTSAGDPVKIGVVASLQRPGGNVTGLGSRVEELSGKRLELLKEVAPGARSVAVVFYPGSQSEVTQWQAHESAARVLSLSVVPVEIRSAGDISPQIAGIAKLDVGAVTFVGSTLFNANRKQLATAVARLGLPAIYTTTEYSDAGGLLSYGTNISHRFRRAADYVDKILKGANPGDLPIEQQDRIELVVNLKTAKSLGIKIPQSILIRADRVIE